MTPTLSVIIPVHNAADLLPRQLDALASGLVAGSATEIIVVDNRSTDGSSEAAKSWSTRNDIPIRVIPAHDRIGEPFARNVGSRAATSEYIAYCDADDEVVATWCEAMRAGLRLNDYVTGPVETTTLNAPWQVATRREIDRLTPATTYGGVPFAHGCNMGFRRQVLFELGGFDESFLIGCDIEIAVRAWRRGIELTWLPDAKVHYRLRASLREAYRQARAYSQARSRIRGLLPDQVDVAAERRATARRVAWMVRHIPNLATTTGRARWVWVAGQVAGEIRSVVTSRTL